MMKGTQGAAIRFSPFEGSSAVREEAAAMDAPVERTSRSPMNAPGRWESWVEEGDPVFPKKSNADRE